MKSLKSVALVGLVLVGYLQHAYAGAVEVKVTLRSDCTTRSVVPAKATVSKSRDDIVVWRFASECAKPLKAYVCPQGENPLLDCAGTAFAVMNKPFTIYPGGAMAPTSAVLCPVNWSVLVNPACTPSRDCPTFEFQAKVGPATGSDPTCPMIGPRVSEIAIEVVP